MKFKDFQSIKAIYILGTTHSAHLLQFINGMEKVETPFYTLGIGPGNNSGDFESAGVLQEYQGNLYVGNQGTILGNGGVFVYNPNTPLNNFIQLSI